MFFYISFLRPPPLQAAASKPVVITLAYPFSHHSTSFSPVVLKSQTIFEQNLTNASKIYTTHGYIYHRVILLIMRLPYLSSRNSPLGHPRMHTNLSRSLRHLEFVQANITR